MQAIKITEANRDKILEAMPEYQRRVVTEENLFEFFGGDDRYFIKNLTEVATGQPTGQWASMTEESFHRYLDVGKGDISTEWISVSRKELKKFTAIEIKTPMAARIAQGLMPHLYSKSYEDLKGKFLVLDYPIDGYYELVDPAFWDDSHFSYIENGPVIRLKKFTLKDDI